jgi:hypothetical protein
MAENRISRDEETRTKDARKKAWERPQVLPNPNPEEGYSFKWIRISTLGEVDATNISSKLREGWEPVKAKNHPEIHLIAAANQHEQFKDNVVIGGLLLCKVPVELVEERNAYYEEQARAQVESVDNNYMREDDPRMKKFAERSSKVTFGSGN